MDQYILLGGNPPLNVEQGENNLHNKPFYNPNSQIAQNSTLHTYIPNKYPPDLEFARKHGTAKRVATSKADDSSTKIDVCECCGLPIENELLPLCSDRTDLASFGPGYPLYFEFVFYCIIMLAIIFFIFGIYAIASNHSSDDCVYEKTECTNNFINSISISNKINHHDSYLVQTWVNLATVIVIMISLHIFRKVQRLTTNECDRGLISPSDFTIMIGKLPKNLFSEEDVKKTIYDKLRLSFDEQKKGGDLIKKINLAYEINPLVENITKLKQIENKLRSFAKAIATKSSLPKGVSRQELEQQKEDLTQKIEQFIKVELKKDSKSMLNNTCGVAFVTFSNQQIPREIVAQYEYTLAQKVMSYIKYICCFGCCCHQDDNSKLKFRGTILYVERAPEPNDIKWENLGFSSYYKYKKRFATTIYTLLVLVVCFSAIFGISYYQNSEQEKYKKKISGEVQAWIRTLGFLASFLIVFINTCLLLCIRYFASLEKHTTVTHLDISVAQKLSIAQFSNTALITFLANYVLLTDKRLFVDGGLVTDLFSIFLSNAFIPIIMTYCNPWYAFRLYKRWRTKNEGEKSFVTQEEANEMFEGGPLDFAYKYAIMIKTMWFTSFYVCIIPFGVIFSILNLIGTYLLDKYLILRRYARTPLLSADLNKEMIELLEYCPFLMSIGSLIFHNILFNPSYIEMIPEYIAIGLSCINFIFPSARVNEILCKIDENVDGSINYENYKKFFTTDYDRVNPITKEQAMREYILLAEEGKVEANPDQLKELKNAVEKLPGDQGILNYVMHGANVFAMQNKIENKNIFKTRKTLESKAAKDVELGTNYENIGKEQEGNQSNINNFPTNQQRGLHNYQENQQPAGIYPNINNYGQENQIQGVNYPSNPYQGNIGYQPNFYPGNQVGYPTSNNNQQGNYPYN